MAAERLLIPLAFTLALTTPVAAQPEPQVEVDTEETPLQTDEVVPTEDAPEPEAPAVEPDRRATQPAPLQTRAEDPPAEAESKPHEAPFDLRRAAVLSLGPVRVAPIVLLQAHAAPYVGNDAFFQSGDIAERGGFRLRHTRFGFDTRYQRDAILRVSTELGGSNDGRLRINDAFIGWTTFPFFQVLAGAQTVPISRFANLRSGRLALIDRPFSTRAMSPGRQVGVVGRGWLWNRALGYQVGVFNGLQRANAFYEGFEQNYAPFGNRFDGLSYAVRITSEPIGPLAGTSADETKDPEVRFGVGANYMFSDGGARDIHTAGGDAHLQVAGFHLIAEALWARIVPEADPTQTGALPFELTNFSFVGEAGYMIIAETLGATARFEWIDPNTAVDDEGDNWMVTGGAHYQFIDQVLKLQAEYTHREERFGPSLANDTVTISLQGMLDPARPRGLERPDLTPEELDRLSRQRREEAEDDK